MRVATSSLAALVGYPEYAQGAIYNAAALFADGALVASYRKRLLPNYSVFDEQRYFRSGDRPVVASVRGVPVGIGICEDLWEPAPCADLRGAGAALVLVPNGSPFEVGKQRRREEVLAARARETGLPIAYANMVGGQDELVFDGDSLVVGADGELVARAPQFAEALLVVDLDLPAGEGYRTAEIPGGPVAPYEPLPQ